MSNYVAAFRATNLCKAILFDPTTSFASAQITLGSMSTGLSPSMSVCRHPQGGAIVVWGDNSGTQQLLAQWVKADGSLGWGSGTALVIHAPGAVSSVRSIRDASGGFFLAWMGGATLTDVYAARLGADGAILWGPTLICNAANQQGEELWMCPDASGGLILAWKDERLSATGEVYAQRITSGGATLWAANGLKLAGTSTDALRIAADGTGGVFVVQLNTSATGGKVRCWRFDGNGANVWGGLNGVDATPNFNGAVSYVSAIANEAGDLIVAGWTIGLTPKAHTQKLRKSDGSLQWNFNGLSFGISFSSGTNQNTDAICTDGNGGAWFVGVGNSTDVPSEPRYRAYRVTNTGTLLGPYSIGTSSGIPIAAAPISSGRILALNTARAAIVAQDGTVTPSGGYIIGTSIDLLGFDTSAEAPVVGASPTFLTRWRAVTTRKPHILVKLTLVPANGVGTQTAYLARAEIATPAGSSQVATTWQAAIDDMGPIHPPGQFQTNDVGLTPWEFSCPRIKLGFQAAGKTIFDALKDFRFDESAIVQVYLWEEGLTNFNDALLDYTGRIISYEVNEGRVSFLCQQRSDWNQIIQPLVVTRAKYPRAPDGVIGTTVPIIYGKKRGPAMRAPFTSPYATEYRGRELVSGGRRVSRGVLVDTGRGNGSDKARVLVASHPVKQFAPASPTFGTSPFFEGDDGKLHALDPLVADVFLAAADGAGFYMDDTKYIAYFPVFPTDVNIVANMAKDPRHAIDYTNEQTYARLDYSAGYRELSLPLPPISDPGAYASGVQAYAVLLYRTYAGTSDLKFSTFPAGAFDFGTAVPASLTPARLDLALGTGWAGPGLPTNPWNFDGTNIRCYFGSSTPAGKADIFMMGVFIPYRPRRSMIQSERRIPLARNQSVSDVSEGNTRATYNKGAAVIPAVTEIAGSFCTNVDGWPDSATFYAAGIDLARILGQGYMSFYGTGTIIAGYQCDVAAGYSDIFRLVVTGVATYDVTLAPGAMDLPTRAAALVAQLNALPHGRVFSFSITNDILTLSINSGTFQIDRQTYPKTGCGALGYRIGVNPAAAATAVAEQARPANRYWWLASGANVTWQWASMSAPALALVGFNAVNDAVTWGALADYAVAAPFMLIDGVNDVFLFTDGTPGGFTLNLSAGGDITGTVGALIERGPDIAQHLLTNYGAQTAAQIERTVGVPGSFIDARAKLKTWRNQDMVHTISVTDRSDVMSVLAKIAEHAGLWLFLSTFDDKWKCRVWDPLAVTDYSWKVSRYHIREQDGPRIWRTPTPDIATSVRVLYGYDYKTQEFLHEAMLSADASLAGHAYYNLRDGSLKVVPGINDRLDVVDAGVTRAWTIPGGSYATGSQLGAALAAAATGGSIIMATLCGEVVAGVNDAIGWKEGASLFSATLTPGQRNMEDHCAMVQAKMNAAGAGGWSVTYSRTTGKVTWNRTGTNSIQYGGPASPALLGMGVPISFVSDPGTFPFTAQYAVDERRMVIGSSGAQLDLLFAGGVNAATAAADVLGFDRAFDRSVTNQNVWVGDCPKSRKEEDLAALAPRFRKKRDVVIEARTIDDTDTALEVRDRFMTLAGKRRVFVDFTTDYMPDIDRGQVFEFDADMDQVKPYPNEDSDGSWVGKRFMVIEPEQNCGPLALDRHIVAVSLD